MGPLESRWDVRGASVRREGKVFRLNLLRGQLARNTVRQVLEGLELYKVDCMFDMYVTARVQQQAHKVRALFMNEE